MGRSLAENASSLKCAQVVVVSDVDDGKGRALAGDLGSDFASDTEQVLARDDVDAILIATPGFLHEPPALAAAAAGKHIFCEKPLAPTLDGCDRILDASEQHGVSLGVGLVCRFHPVHREVTRLVRSGDLGSASCMHVHRLGGGLSGAWEADWRRQRATSGGNLMEINAHEIDFMRAVMGEAKTVYAAGGSYGPGGFDFPDTALVTVHFDGGGIGLLHSSQACHTGGYGGRVDCADGSITFPRFRGDDGGVTIKVGDEDGRFIPAADLVSDVSPVAQEIEAFVVAVLGGDLPPVSGRDGRAATEIAVAAYASIESGKPVDLSVD